MREGTSRCSGNIGNAIGTNSNMNRIFRQAPLSALLAFFFAAALNTAFAYGELDPTFKPEGLVGASCSDAQAVVTDGSIYTLINRTEKYRMGVVRHRADGSIDKSWGRGGVVDLSEATYLLLPTADGALVVIGNHVSRYRRDGGLDLSFGNGGISNVVEPFGSLLGISLQTDGSIVALSRSADGRVFTRINRFGIADINFGIDGYLSIPYSAVPKDVAIFAWSVESDGSVQLAWYKQEPGVPVEFKFEIKRFRRYFSTADTSFDAGGRLVPRQGVADWLAPQARVQANGALLLGTEACIDTGICRDSRASVSRFDAFGNVDAGFGERGQTGFRIFGTIYGNESPSTFLLGNDARLTVFVAGSRRFGSFGVDSAALGTYVYRTQADGTLDAGFENGKKIASPFTPFIQLDDGRLLRPGSVDGGCAPQKYLTDTPRTAAVVVEYYSPTLNHYFMTAHEFEKDFVDRGLAGDWQRTGQVFGAFSIDAPMPGTSPVCRYYGGANGGPNSHFYSAEKFECDILARLEAQTPPDKPAWRFERDAFRITLPVEEICPPNLTPLYRLYNRGAELGKDSNHRYTTDFGILAEMQAKGWASEGVHMCMPPASRSDRMPF